MSNQLLITKGKGKIISALYENQELIQVNTEDLENETLVGNIYIGKVKNIVKNINAAFVEIENGLMCYFPLSKKEKPIFCNHKNTDKVCIGDEIIVQISKDAVKTKNPSVTANLQFSGKYVILTHGNVKIGISNKIQEPEERERLKQIVRPFVGEKKGCGIIVRTNSSGVSADIIEREARQLYEQYTELVHTGVYKSCFTKLYQAPAGYLCDIRNGYEEEIEGILTDDKEIYETILTYMKTYSEEDCSKVKLYTNEMISLNRLYGVETKIEKALQKNVWLKSGGYLVIQPTEAMTVIDVNTGKAIEGKKNVEEHFLKINKEAAKEVAKQLRLRNYSGIIIIDFIDMVSEKAKKELIQCLESYIKKDPVKTVFVDITKLNLVELTRKKVRKPLHEQWK